MNLRKTLTLYHGVFDNSKYFEVANVKVLWIRSNVERGKRRALKEQS